MDGIEMKFSSLSEYGHYIRVIKDEDGIRFQSEEENGTITEIVLADSDIEPLIKMLKVVSNEL